MTKRIAIIPARGGSKRIPNKNVRDFCGKPIIAYILRTARESGLFDEVHVSTDSETICKTVERLGFKIEFMRPSELADDHTPIMPVLRYVTEKYASFGRDFDQVWLLMACAPLVKSSDLQQVAQLFEQAGGATPVLSVSEYPAPIEWAFCRGADGKMVPVQPGMFAIRSQDLENKYFDAGAFVVFPALTVQKSEWAGSDTEFIGYVIPKGSAIDIDEEEDWLLAEALYQLRAQK